MDLGLVYLRVGDRNLYSVSGLRVNGSRKLIS